MKKKLNSAKNLLQKHALPLDANSFYKGLTLSGAMHEVEYLSTSGSGEVKNFWQFTSEGERFGENKKNHFHEFKTEPRFFEAVFLHAYVAACKAISEHALKICGTAQVKRQDENEC